MAKSKSDPSTSEAPATDPTTTEAEAVQPVQEAQAPEEAPEQPSDEPPVELPEPEAAPEIPEIPDGIPESAYQLSHRFVPCWIRWTPELRAQVEGRWIDRDLDRQMLPILTLEDSRGSSRWLLGIVLYRVKAHHIAIDLSTSWLDQILEQVDVLMRRHGFLGAEPIADPSALADGVTEIEINPTELQFVSVPNGRGFRQLDPEDTVQFRAQIRLVWLEHVNQG